MMIEVSCPDDAIQFYFPICYFIKFPNKESQGTGEE